MHSNILYINPDNRDNQITKSNPVKDSFLRDLKLDLILMAISMDDPYLKTLYQKLFLHPSIDIKEIKMRQEILSEALHYQHFLEIFIFYPQNPLRKSTITVILPTPYTIK